MILENSGAAPLAGGTIMGFTTGRGGGRLPRMIMSTAVPTTTAPTTTVANRVRAQGMSAAIPHPY